MRRFFPWIKITTVYISGIFAGIGALIVALILFDKFFPRIQATPPTPEQVYQEKLDAFNNLPFKEQQQVKLFYGYAQNYAFTKDVKGSIEMLSYLHEILPHGYKSSKAWAEMYKLQDEADLENQLEAQRRLFE